MLLNFLPFHSADDDGGTGSGEAEGGVKPSDILNRYGQTAEAALRMAEKLAEAENKLYRLREKNRAMTQERDALQANQPADGAVVLSAEDAKELEAYRTLGKPTEVKQALDGAKSAAEDLATLRRKSELHDVQAVTGFDPDVLGDIGANWSYRIADEQADGKPVKVVYVKEGEQEQRIDQHPKVQKFMPALKPQGEQAKERNTLFIQQHGGTGSAGDLADQFIQRQAEKRAATPNPLMKQGA